MTTNVDEVRPPLMVSNSDIKMFKDCRRKWNLSSFNRRNLVPKKPNIKFWIGTGCHYALERWHGYGEEPVEVFRQWAREQIFEISGNLGKYSSPTFWDEINEMVELGKQILASYVVYAEKHLLPKFKFIATEYEFSVPIPGHAVELRDAFNNPYPWVIAEWGQEYWDHEQFKTLYVARGLYDSENGTIPALYVGRLDGLVMDSNGHVWVIDHKFMAALVDPEMLLIDEQTAKYAWAANVCIENGWWPEVATGTTVRGCLYNVVRKKAPTIPKLLKNGSGLSQNKSIDTTEEVFKATILEHGFNPSDYLDILLQLRAKGNKFFQLEKVERGEYELALVGERMAFEYRDMAEAAAISRDIMHPAMYPNPKMDCRWACAFKNICYMANYGGDAESLIKETMVPQERRDLYATQIVEEE